MPYSLDDTPERLKGKGIPRKFIRQYIHVFNGVLKRTGDEQRAHKAAVKVMYQSLRDAGYRKDEDGKWHKTEEAMGTEFAEGWLSISQNELDDGDFAWISSAWKKASPAEREKMNKREHRKLPFKIHGKVNVRGWRAAWIAAANPGSARALKSYKGGTSREQVLAKLRRNKPKGITINDDNSISSEETSGMPLLATTQAFKVLEDGSAPEGTPPQDRPPLKFEGVALRDNVLSKNNRYYSTAFNDRCMERTNDFMENGGTVTIYSRHGNAFGSFGSLPTALPIGRVIPPLKRVGSDIAYIGSISATQEGLDVRRLMLDEVMLATSIRANQYKSVPRKLDNQDVEDMTDAVLAGIDFTDDPGIVGAGVKRILEEAPAWEEDMNWEEVTLEELLEHCGPLLQEHAATLVEAVQAQVTELQGVVEDMEAAIAVLDEENATAEEKLATAETDAKGAIAEAIEALELELEIAKAAHVGSMSRTVFEELKANVESKEQIADNLAAAREKAMTLVLASASAGKAKGQTRFEDEDEDDDDEPMTEEAKKVLSLSL